MHIVVAALAALAVFAAPASAARTHEDCVSDCTQIVTSDSKHAATRQSACAKFQAQLPRPTVLFACEDGFRSGPEAACQVLCDHPAVDCASKLITEPIFAERREKVCGPFANRRPYPLLIDSCQAGFETSAINACTFHQLDVRQLLQVTNHQDKTDEL